MTEEKQLEVQNNLETRNTKTAIRAGAVAVLMVGLAYASVPLYDLFCRVTGFGGTTQVAEQAPSRVGDRKITVRFDASLNRGLNWDFAPISAPMSVSVGETGLAFYGVKNLTDASMTGTATFNVSPAKAGYYFNKIECFCFTEQVLKAGETAEMPVTFFVDPEIMDDPEMDDVSTITLSYTFFKAPETACSSLIEPRG